MFKHRGMTLIEIMVVLAILVLIIVAAVPLGRAWVANAHIARAEATLLQAYQIARATALKNVGGLTGTAAVSTLDLSVNPTLKVTENSSSPASDVWTSNINSDTIIAITDSTCANKVSLNNLGLPDSSNCLVYSVSSSGGTTKSGSLH